MTVNTGAIYFQLAAEHSSSDSSGKIVVMQPLIFAECSKGNNHDAWNQDFKGARSNGVSCRYIEAIFDLVAHEGSVIWTSLSYSFIKED